MSDVWARDASYPKRVIDLARRRVAGLTTQHVLQVESLPKLLQAAYLQGLRDAIEVATDKELDESASR